MAAFEDVVEEEGPKEEVSECGEENEEHVLVPGVFFVDMRQIKHFQGPSLEAVFGYECRRVGIPRYTRPV